MKTQNDGKSEKERDGEKNWLTMEKVPKERRGNVQELITRENFRT